MARLQILELPTVYRGEEPGETPFVLVIDQLHEDLIDDVTAASERTAELIGARTILAFTDTVEIPANGPHLGEAATVTDGVLPEELARATEKELTECKIRCRVDRECRALLSETLGLGQAQGWDDIRTAVTGLLGQINEARMWARHGYEIGQKHCGWTDHGTAPAWLTEDWPTSFEPCEHLKQASEYDEALSRVRHLPVEPDAMNAQQPHPSVWLHGYKCGVRAARSAIRPRNEPTVKP